ncbi:MAG: glycosyltransferase family 2 protein [Bacteroidales bacterium]|nr:glycosyltransferase family 2 protein [Bacteroidales bacterium]
MKLKDIRVLTMVRNDRFLKKWVEYYGTQLEKSHLYVYFDGEDQEIPDFCEGVHTRLIPKMQGDVVATDHQRSRFISERASELFSEGAEMVIATDADEFLIVDPAIGKTLPEFLSSLPEQSCWSGLGVDVLQHLPTEGKIDFDQPFLSQRFRGFLYSRYTKPSVITRPLIWGGGYHRVKGENYHIAPGLYLFHFGGVDLENLREISSLAERKENGWDRHQRKRERTISRLSALQARPWEPTVEKVRKIQTFCRPVTAWNKPTTFGMRYIVAIPERFRTLL